MRLGPSSGKTLSCPSLSSSLQRKLNCVVVNQEPQQSQDKRENRLLLLRERGIEKRRLWKENLRGKQLT